MKCFFLTLFILSGLSAFAQTDSIVYERQRKKINDLLDERNERFGQFDVSLSQKTGIFGWKTKKDMQRSLDILAEIAKTDNNILKETKVLLDYKDLQKSQVQTKVIDVSGRINNYMKTITKLQIQNDRLNTELQDAEKRNSTLLWISIVSGLIALGLLVFIFSRRQHRASH
ncbi:hypothetical protein [Hufsiella arboris]|nr:hypothetical protein [Hufsiella arboris]